ncbi:MAG: RodZ domain-containing protein [Pseudomonadota bacterium]
MSAEDLSADSSGATLAAAREAASVSQRDVADALHLPVHVVAAIERGDKTQLPAFVFTRGYVRAYAKLLDLDPDPLVTALSFEYGATTQERHSPQGMDSVSPPSGVLHLQQLVSSNITLLALLGGVLLIVILVVVLVTTLGGDDDPDLAPAAVTPAPEPAVELSSPVRTTPATATTEGASPPDAAEPALVSDIEPVASPDSQPDAASVQAAGDPSAATEATLTAAPELAVAANAGADTGSTGEAAPPALQRLTASGDERLTLQFTDECWVEIRNAEGDVLFGDLGQPGQTLEFVGSGPFRVLLGYASGAIMLYNAEPVALSPHTRNNMARLVIGQ